MIEKPEVINKKKLDGYLLRASKDQRKKQEDEKDIDINISKELEMSITKGKKLPTRY